MKFVCPKNMINIMEQAGAELCQAQDKLEVVIYIGVKVEFEPMLI